MSILDDQDILAKRIESKMTVGGHVTVGVYPPETLYQDPFQKYWGAPIETIIDIIRDTVIDDKWRSCIYKLDLSAKTKLRSFNICILENIIKQAGLQSRYVSPSVSSLIGHYILENDKSVCKVIVSYYGWNFYFESPEDTKVDIQLRKLNTSEFINSML